MASLKDTVVSGSLRATDTLYSTTNQFQILKIPTSSGGTTYGPGSNGQILKSNGTSVYWAADNNTTDLGSMTGTLAVGKGGTGATTAAGARANLSTWSFISDSYNTIMPPDGTTNAWYKFGTSNTSYGILPSTSGAALSGHNYIGTSKWYWKYSYIDEMFSTRLHIVHNSSDNTDNAVVYIENKSSADWGTIINCDGYDYGLRIVTTNGAGSALVATGVITGTSFTASYSGTTNIISQNTLWTKGTAPSSTLYETIAFVDSKNVRNGLLEAYYTTDKTTSMQLGVYDDKLAIHKIELITNATGTSPALCFSQNLPNIQYAGSKGTYTMIQFIDNTNDNYGNGIAIGGGGQTIIGGGESASTMAAQVGTAGAELMYVGNDGNVSIFTNLQSGWANRKEFLFDSAGSLTITGKAILGTSTGVFHPSGAPILYFLRGNSTVTTNKLGAIFLNYGTTNSITRPDTMYFRIYTYNSSTGAVSENWEQYKFPSVSADRTTSATYNILTTKNISVSNTWANGTTAGPTISTTVNGTTGTAVAVPSATESISGVVTTTTQTFAGAKTFNANVAVKKTTMDGTSAGSYASITFGHTSGTSAIGSGTTTNTYVDHASWALFSARSAFLRKTYATAGNASSTVTASSVSAPRMRFSLYSYDSSTAARTSGADFYYFPYPPKDFTGANNYYIYTTKNIMYGSSTPSARSDGTALVTGDIWLKPI